MNGGTAEPEKRTGENRSPFLYENIIVSCGEVIRFVILI